VGILFLFAKGEKYLQKKVESFNCITIIERNVGSRVSEQNVNVLSTGISEMA